MIALASSLGGCTTNAPALPADEGETYNRLTGPSGRDFLDRISVHQWPDGGARPANLFSWVARDAHSPNVQAAERSGQAAHAIGSYLAENRPKLERLQYGWFGLRHQSIGQRNPQLVRGYGSALAAFQGAMIGDAAGTRGFDPFAASAGDYSPARNVFALIDTDTQAGKDFTAAAYNKADAYANGFAIHAGGSSNPHSADLAYAAVLSGVADGAARQSRNPEIHTRTAQQALDYAAYVIAAALHPKPGDLDDNFFTNQGQLKSPDQISGESDKIHYSEQLQLFISRQNGLGLAMNRFEGEFDQAAGYK